MQRLATLVPVFALACFLSAPAQAQWRPPQALSGAREGLASATVGSLTLVAGGSGPSSAVDVYNSVTGTITPGLPLSVARSSPAATVVGNLAFFAGGGASATTPSAVVDVFDASSMTWIPSLPLSQARSHISATTVGSYAIFAGGTLGAPSNPTGLSDRVDIYDASVGAPDNPLAWSTLTRSFARAQMTPAAVGNRALFAGGQTLSTVSNMVDIYDASMGAPNQASAWSTAVLSQPRAMGVQASATVGTRAYFAGGFGVAGSISDQIDLYDAQTRLWSSSLLLSTPRGGLSATAIGNTVLFAGGIITGDPGVYLPSDLVDILNAATGSFGPTSVLSQSRAFLTAATVGNQAVFAGGSLAPGVSSAVVDIFDPSKCTQYCTAKTNSQGCVPAIGSSGIASASSGSDFFVNGTNFINNKSCLLFYGVSGQATTPFQGGTLCVKSPIKRTPGTTTGGTAPPNNCSGAPSIDMNLFAVGGLGGTPLPALQVFGTIVDCQWWGRDPGIVAPNNTQLSDALEYIVWP
jgi:hypothetical protein